MNDTDCRVCHAEGIMSERGLCPCCEALAEIARKNLEGAAKSKLKPPKRCPKCIDCGGPTRPVLFRPEGPWTFTCVVECYPCRQCKKLFRGDETCPHDPRVKHSVAGRPVQ